ncbi:SDR family oxidoreductase [Levilactobacillus bambusae]|uniref:NAD-dependent dehydratase n=1 Tax=Levilactobacillus bambusae TaxID=2024736 RepID=A0A2V1MZC2_9LACO|nr:SDR family oxidoreductase [Levilactobacillus bambusae]PWG00364.1 NAD-dependent dehydratase [Levilactobacillus bambusae]
MTKVFVTGATGFIGSAVVDELLQRGYQVTGLARSDRSAKQLTDKGAEAVSGSLTDLDVLAEAAKQSDGVIHLGFTNDFNHMDQAVKQDVAAIEAMGDALVGTNKPFVNTSGTLMVAFTGRPATEDDAGDPSQLRTESEVTSLNYAGQAVRATAIRLSPTVHDETRQGFGTIAASIAVNNGYSAYFGAGQNEWPSVHRLDAADLFVKAFERGVAGTVYNAAAEEGIPFKVIAETISQTVGIPLKSLAADEAKAYAGPYFGPTLQINNPTSSAKTQAALGWNPTHPTLVEDMTTFLSSPANVDHLKNN